uniref:Uncharacterized protein n=1 Tax=viral metagenome TaxID=1070528 RepID=A0A6H1ZBT0_9ZZZZ
MFGKMRDIRNAAYRQIAGWLPKRLVYFCALRLMIHATSGKYGNTEVPALTGMDALARWTQDNWGWT